MNALRVPFFLFALLAVLIAVGIDVGGAFLAGGPDATELADLIDGDAEDAGLSADDLPQGGAPGLGIPSMACIDGLVLFTAALYGLGLVIPERLTGRVQGIATFIVALVTLCGGAAAVFVAVGKLLLMVGLLLALPFGTLAYFAIWGFFDRPGASALLSVSLFLKLAFGVLLVLAQQRFLQNKGLVLIVLSSLLCNVVVSFLHGLVPRPLVSIADAVAAIVVLVLGIIWAIVFLIGSIPAMIKVLRGTRG